MWFWLSLKIQSIVVGVYAKGAPHRAINTDCEIEIFRICQKPLKISDKVGCRIFLTRLFFDGVSNQYKIIYIDNAVSINVYV